MPRIYNQKTMPIPHDAVRVDRGTKWGNPFVMRDGSDMERNRVCEAYEKWIKGKPDLIAAARHELKGCAPKRCHAETLMRIANEG